MGNIKIKDAFIVNGVRTAIASFQGSLSAVRTDDLAALVIAELMAKNKTLETELIDDVILGCANQAGEDNRNIARMALLLAGLPFTVPGETVNRLCASGLSAIVHAARAIHCGEGEVFIAGGIEHMTRGPFVLSKSPSAFGRDQQLYDSSFGWRFVNPKMEEVFGIDSMGNTAENLAEKFSINREDQDKFAHWSQSKAAKAQSRGRFAEEIVNVEIPQRKKDPIKFEKDEFIKGTTTLEILSKLKPAFKPNGTVTAGNSSGLNDGAAALLICSEDALNQHKLKPLARIVSSAVTGVEPRIMGIGPVTASKKALERAGLRMEDLDIIELNEAFAAQSLACIRQWGLEDQDARINPNGGAIALGHPLGMSGARLALSAALELHNQNKKYALVTMCVGVGQGYATVLEKC